MNFVQSLNQIFTTNNYEDQDDRGRLKWYVEMYHPLKNFLEFPINIRFLRQIIMWTWSYIVHCTMGGYTVNL